VRLPDSLADLPQLCKLKVSHNALQRIPRSYSRFLVPRRATPPRGTQGSPRTALKLKSFQFEGNPIVYPPKIVCDMGWLSVLAYLENPIDFALRNFHDWDSTVVSSSSMSSSSSDLSPEKVPVLMETANDLLALLCDKSGRKSFSQFLKKEFNEENLLFWEAIDTLNKQESLLEPQDFQTEALLIFFKFIQTTDQPQGAPGAAKSYEVNLPYELKNDCVGLFNPESESYCGPPSCSDIKKVFGAAQANIFQMLSFDCFRRFVKSEDFILDFNNNKIPQQLKKYASFFPNPSDTRGSPASSPHKHQPSPPSTPSPHRNSISFSERQPTPTTTSHSLSFSTHSSVTTETAETTGDDYDDEDTAG